MNRWNQIDPSVAEAIERYYSAQAELEAKRMKKVKRIVFCVVGALVVLALLFWLIRYAIPYAEAEKAFEAGDYDTAYQKYTQLGSYSEAAVKANTCVLAENYQKGEQALASEDYDQAIYYFGEAWKYKDGSERKFEAAMLKAEKLYSEEKYSEAADFLNETSLHYLSSSKEVDILKKMVDCAVKIAEDGDYDGAMAILRQIRYGSEDESFQQYVNYVIGVISLNKEDYYEAAESFITVISLDGELDDQQLENIFSAAENCLRLGDLIEAKTLYEHFPQDYAVNGISCAERISLLENNREFYDITGKWEATSGHFSIRASYNGYTYSANDDTVDGETLTVRCPYNDDSKTFGIVADISYPCFGGYQPGAIYVSVTSGWCSLTEDGLAFLPETLGTSQCNLTLNDGKFAFSYKYTKNLEDATTTYNIQVTYVK